MPAAVNALFLDPAETLATADRGRNAAFAMSLVIMVGGMWLVMHLGTLVLARTRFKFLFGFLVALAVVAVSAGALCLGGVAMEPAFRIEWSLGRYVHPAFQLYAGFTFLVTLSCFVLTRRLGRA
jgi:hypothetical protein